MRSDLEKIVIDTLLFALCPLLLVAQAPDTVWTRTYGGSGVDQCWGRAAQQTTDGGYVIFGHTNSFGAGNDDIYVVKTDSIGDTLWTKTFGGSGTDQCLAGLQTIDGGYFLASWTTSLGADSADLYLIKTDANGDSLWTKMIGGAGDEWASGAEQTADNGYIITGFTTSIGAGARDLYLVKTDANGDTIWTKTYGGTDDDMGYEVAETNDGSYVIAAWTRSFGSGDYDAWILKTDSLGDTLWTVLYGGSLMDKACNVRETSDNCYVVCGWAYSFGGSSQDNEAFLLKINSNGDTLWTKVFGGIYHDSFYGLRETADSGYVALGLTEAVLGNADVYLLKTDANGDSLWSTTFGGDSVDRGYSVQQTTDSGYIIAGFTNSYGTGSDDLYLIKTGPEQAIEEKNRELILQDNIITTLLTGPLLLPEGVTYRVFDITGCTVAHEKMKPGIYFVEIDGVITQKVVKIR